MIITTEFILYILGYTMCYFLTELIISELFKLVLTKIENKFWIITQTKTREMSSLYYILYTSPWKLQTHVNNNLKILDVSSLSLSLSFSFPSFTPVLFFSTTVFFFLLACNCFFSCFFSPSFPWCHFLWQTISSRN